MSCRAYVVSCVPLSSPARGYLSLAPPDFRLQEHHFCSSPGSSERPWLIQRMNAQRNTSAPPPPLCTCPTASLLPRKGVGVPPLATCAHGTQYLVLQCSAAPLLPPMLARPLEARRVLRLHRPSRSKADVLLVVSDSRGHGFFAMVERVANQLLFARSERLEPWVFVGELTFAEATACEFGRQGYFDAAHGENVWEYFFVQPGSYRLGDAQVAGRPLRSIQVVDPQALYSLQLDTGPTATYAGSVIYKEGVMRRFRSAAHRLFANGSLVQPQILALAEKSFAPWRTVSAHILGVHVRGTDKVVQKKVPPEAYFPIINAWIKRYQDALIFVATDDRDYLERIVNRYGCLGYETANVIIDPKLNNFRKGLEVLVDAILLSKCDFLLKTTSAVAEFAIWVNLALHNAHIDLQYEDRFRSQRLPEWAAHVAADDAKTYCAALEQGCARDQDETRPQAMRLGHRCARCVPSAKRTDMIASSLAKAVPPGMKCDSSNGLRLMTLPECVAYSQAKHLTFLGTQMEKSEFPGCIRWANKLVEFNEHTEQRNGCFLKDKGYCMCTEQLNAARNAA